MLKFHCGDVTVVELRDGLLTAFPDIDNIAVSTMWQALKNEIGLSYKRSTIRNPRILLPLRGVQIDTF